MSRFDTARHYRQEHISVMCEECDGRGFFAQDPCEKCSGLGRLVLPMRQPSFFKQHPTLKRVLLCAAAVAIVVAACAALLAL